MNQSAKNKRQRGNANRAKLKRQKNAKNVFTGVNRPAKKRSTALAKKQGGAGVNKKRENRAAKKSGIAKSKEAKAGFSSKPDKWYKGRNLYPTAGKDGATIYLPQKSDATPSELLKGQFVKDVDVGKEVAAGVPPKEDQWYKGRNLYPTLDENGKTIYLPQQSDATPSELLKGQFVKDVDTGKEVLNGVDPKPDRWYKGRNLYPTLDENGKMTYLPQKSEATPSELLKGQFVKDVDAGKEVLNDVDPKPDWWYKGRNLYPTLDENGKTTYLPQKSDATPAERLKGNYVKDVDAGKDAIEGYAPKEDKWFKGRNLYATLGDEGEVVYLPQESDATPSELQKGQFVKEVDQGKKVREVLPKNTKPKIDAQGRMLYPVKTQSDGRKEELVYYPKESEATASEKTKGQFVRDEEVINEHPTRRRAQRASKPEGRNRRNAVTEI
ncbi:hypothetical protein [uncultured Microscilla sp.]|uniref:hypothetical protein n=1 Tax=uncultured Microscilla sp. TaxID=432653 RepID=UPI00260F468A|nr:hypothetical protein [uncultured Microscilla sp.]